MRAIILFGFFTLLASTNAKFLNLDKWVKVPSVINGTIKMVQVNLGKALPQPFFEVTADVEFNLYTLKNPKKPQVVSPHNLTTILASNYNPNVPTRFFIHGWQERGNMKKHFTEAYFEKAKVDVNLMYVNWERASQSLNYIAARSYVEPTGAYIAEMIDFMIDNKILKLSDVTVIGFSLGAHMAGVAGKHVRSGKIPKIVGLDPAGPLFSMDRPHERLDKLDAKYVEIIHTNGAALGFYNPIGTVEFYPNRGLVQKGCTWDPTGICSHVRAFKYFAESIYSSISFYGYPCDSFEHMKRADCGGVGVKFGGEPGNYKTPAQIYYLKTNSKAIFAQGGSRDL